MKATYRRQLEARKTCLQRMLDRVSTLGPETESAAHLDDFAYAKDYLISWIDRVQCELADGLENAGKASPENAPFATPQNRLDNRSTTGAR